MQKTLIAMLFGAVLFLSGMLVLEKGDDLLNGPVPTDAQRDSLGKRLVRAVTNWIVDKGMREDPPENDPSLAIKSRVPPSPVQHLLIDDDDKLNHEVGW